MIVSLLHTRPLKWGTYHFWNSRNSKVVVNCNDSFSYSQYLHYLQSSTKVYFSNKASIGIEISGKSRFWFQYNCTTKHIPRSNTTLILLQCTSSTIKEVRIPEESTVKCLKMVEDPKKRLVKLLSYCLFCVCDEFSCNLILLRFL